MHTYITEPHELRDIIPLLFTYPVLGVDCETRGLDAFEKYTMRSIQIATSPTTSYVINAAMLDPRPLKPLLEHPGIIKLLHNAKFDYKMLKAQCGIGLTNIWDSMICERLITCGIRRENSLYAVVKKYLGQELDKTVRKGFIASTAVELTDEEQAYAARDTEVLFPLYDIHKKILVDQNIHEIAQLEFRVVETMANVELAGCKIDTVAWQKLIDENTAKATDLRKQLVTMVQTKTQDYHIDVFGEVHANRISAKKIKSVNFDSPDQIMEIFEEFGIEAEDSMDGTLAKINDPFVKLLREYREYQKSVSSFGDKFLKLINPVTKRVHTEYNTIGADSGRFSSSNPNLQQIPHSSNFRSCFIAREGYKIITTDMSGAELRILTQLSKDAQFIKSFTEGMDLHTLSGSFAYNVAYDAVSKEQRATGKLLNFSIAYGAGPPKIASSLEISMQAAQRILDNFYMSYAGLRKFLDGAKYDALHNLYAVTAIGRKRYFPEPNDRKESGSIERSGANHRIQGTNADIIKMALVDLYKALLPYDARIINTVHDEIVVEVREDIAVDIQKIIEYEMTKAGETIVQVIPVLVDGHIENCWSKG